MGKAKTAKSFLLKKGQYDKLKDLEYSEELRKPSQDSFPMSSNVESNGKLKWLDVYIKILEGDWKLAPPEKTKTKAGKSSARCWKQGGVSLVLEKGPDEKYYDSGFVIHHQKGIGGNYCGWLQFQKACSRRTSDISKHVKNCICGDKKQEEQPLSGSIFSFVANKETTLDKTDIEEINSSMRK